MKIEISFEEGQALVNVLDVAVKAAGLQAAFVAVPFVAKLQDAIKAESSKENQEQDNA